jgi:uncharacterized protein (TIGR02217 family)
MPIHAKQFPLQLSGLSGGPEFKTDITQGQNNTESRNAAWQDALWRYNAAFAVRDRADIATLHAFFLTCRGRETAFLLHAGDDYKIPQSGSTPQSIAATGTTTYQISKKYTDSLGNVYDRIIRRPSEDPADISVFVNGSPRTHGSQWTYSTTTGIITFSSPPGGTVTVLVNKFYVPVRFDVDHLDVDMLQWWVSAGADKSVHQIPSIPMVEVRDLT